MSKEAGARGCRLLSFAYFNVGLCGHTGLRHVIAIGFLAVNACAWVKLGVFQISATCHVFVFVWGGGGQMY